MTDDEFAAVLAPGYEQRGVEVKGPASSSDRRFMAKIARAVLAMTNRRDGGLVVIGVKDDGRSLDPIGLDAAQLATWTFDDVADKLAVYADPYVSFDLEHFQFQGRDFAILRVHEFEEIPALCKKDFPDALRNGACYVRSRRKPESAEMAGQQDMRELIELATEKRLRRFIAQARAAGLDVSGGPAVADDALFDSQLGNFLK